MTINITKEAPSRGASNGSWTEFASSKDRQPDTDAGSHDSLPDKGRSRSQKWFPAGCWSGFGDQRITGLTSKHPKLPWEVVMICASRSNRWGHARFSPGELAKLLGLKNAKNAYKPLRRLIEAGAIAPDSTPLCVVLDAGLYHRADNRTWTCKEPKHADRRKQKWADFGGFGWESYRDEWDGLMAESLSAEDALARIKARAKPVEVAPVSTKVDIEDAPAEPDGCTCEKPCFRPTCDCRLCKPIWDTWLAKVSAGREGNGSMPALTDRPEVHPYQESAATEPPTEFDPAERWDL